MNRDQFNKEVNRKLHQNDSVDTEWSGDVSFSSLEKKIKENHKAAQNAFRPLDEKQAVKKKAKAEKLKRAKADKSKDTSVSKSENTQVAKSVRKKSKGFAIFMAVWCSLLILAIGVFLYKFYHFLEDYEKVYQDSLAYHEMDEFLNNFADGDYDALYSMVSKKPEITKFESEENVKAYMKKMLSGKTIRYNEAGESTDKIPVYYLTADDYIIGKITMCQSDMKRAYDLPIYSIDTFEFYEEPEWSISVQAYDNCSVYVNGVAVTPEYIYRIDLPKEKHFEGFAQLPLTKYYKVTGLYEQPVVKVVNVFDQEITPTLNHATGVYETPLSVPKEVEDEMISFAKTAVDTYAQVVCREINDSNLDEVFTKGNPIVTDIKSNSDNLKYFPNHKTTDTEDKIIEFIPYTDNAFFCEIEHTQHMLIYGVRPRDVVTDARYYYVKEDGNWKVCAITY